MKSHFAKYLSTCSGNVRATRGSRDAESSGATSVDNCFKEALRAIRCFIPKCVRLAATLSLVSFGVCFAQTTTQQEFAIQHARVVAYSKAFATRFALPELPRDMELTGGIHALEFSIEKGPSFAPLNVCILKAYLDSTLAIALPAEGIAGSRTLVAMKEHFFFYNKLRPDNQRLLSLSPEDRLHFSEQDHFGRHAALATPDLDWPKKGFWGDAIYESFYRELFRGVTYIKLSTWCGFYAELERMETLQLWVKQIGGKDHSQIVKPDPADFLKFNVPNAFLRSANKWAKPAQEYNVAAREMMEEGYRK